MPHRARAAAALGAETVVAFMVDVLSVGNLILGSLILAGGRARMQGGSFAFVIAVAPWWVWGLGFLAAGAVSGAGQWWQPIWHIGRVAVRPIQLGHWAAACACLYWTLAFILGAKYAAPPPAPQPALTGIAAYVIIGTLHLAASATSRPRRDL